MSRLEKLLKEKRETMLEFSRDTYIRLGIISAYLDEHPMDYSFNDCFKKLHAAINDIKRNGCWEPSFDGFVTRANFQYDKESQEITFTTHKITKKDGKYVPDGTPEAIEEFVTHRAAFISLAEADDIIAAYYEKYRDRIDEDLNKAMNVYRACYPNPLQEAEEQNKLYSSYFGEIGIVYLVKWLNRLSNPYDNIDNLAEEFQKDIGIVTGYFESIEDPNYLRSKENNIDMGQVLLEIIKRYSPRGEIFKEHNKKYYKEQPKKK